MKSAKYEAPNYEIFSFSFLFSLFLFFIFFFSSSSFFFFFLLLLLFFFLKTCFRIKIR
jgi:hypothetical protein